MGGSGAASGEVVSRLGEALDAEISRLELRIAQIWIALGAVGLVGALGFGFGRSTALGLSGGIVTAGYVAWFSGAAWLISRGKEGRALRIVGSVVEGTLPWAFLVVLWVTEGPVYALGSWVPPMLFAAIIVASTARLRPIEPLLIGISSGLAFLSLYALFLATSLPAGAADQALYEPSTQLVRGISLVVGGALAMVVARTLRRAIAKAESITREQDLFGKYRLERHIASGGMGSVYAASYCPEGGFERPVAIKRIHPHLAEEKRFVDAFRREAELSARLVHSNIIQVLDFGSIGDSYFLAMEYVEGLTLRALTQRARALEIEIPLPVVAHVCREILAGLEYSHRAARSADGTLLRVIHRDLCPANVLLSRQGAVKITDFGIARALRDAATADTTTVAGHAAYMAPEQTRAEPVDARADLFALGAIVWELLCGRPAFRRHNEEATILAVLGGDAPAPSTLRAGLGPGWDALVLRAVAVDPGERFATAEEMAAALAQLEGAGGPDPDALADLISRIWSFPDAGVDDQETTLDSGADTVRELVTTPS